MKHILLSLAMAMGIVAVVPSPASAQLLGLQQQRLAERQVIGWFQAYLGRLPNAQELAILTNQYMLTGNALYVQSVILASNEFYFKSGNTPAGFINRLFLLTIGRGATVQETGQLQMQVIANGRLWFVQTYLSQIAGGWQLNAWNNAVATVPVPVVVPILIR
jgi:hypothetical protein